MPLKRNETIVFFRALWILSFSAHDAITLFFFSHKRNDKIQSTIFPWRRPRCHVSGAATAPVSGSARDREAALGFWVDERGYAARWGRLVTDSLRASRRRRHLCAFAPPLFQQPRPLRHTDPHVVTLLSALSIVCFISAPTNNYGVSVRVHGRRAPAASPTRLLTGCHPPLHQIPSNIASRIVQETEPVAGLLGKMWLLESEMV